MPFVIHNRETESFMVLVHPNIISWTTEPMNAKKFPNVVKANNFLNNNFHFFPSTKDIDLNSIHVVDYNELCAAKHAPTEASAITTSATMAPDSTTSVATASTTTEMSLSLPPASAHPTEAAPNAVPEPMPRPFDKTVPHTATGSLSGSIPSPAPLDINDVDALLADLPQMISRLCEIECQLIQALTCCANAISQADMETEDILHKIEFVRADVVQGYHLYKDLHDCRLQRRRAKDLMTLLGLIQTSGVLNRVESFRISYESYKNTLSHRMYHPRVRDDLFFPKPVSSDPDLPPEESYMNG